MSAVQGIHVLGVPAKNWKGGSHAITHLHLFHEHSQNVRGFIADDLLQLLVVQDWYLRNINSYVKLGLVTQWEHVKACNQ